MTTESRCEDALVEDPPARALMIYDGDCGFCTDVAYRWRRRIGPSLEIAALQDDRARPPELPVEALEREVHLVEPDGTVFRGAAAVFRAMAMNRRWAWLWWLYRTIPGFRPVSEWVYGWVADNRTLVSKLTRWLRPGDPTSPP